MKPELTQILTDIIISLKEGAALAASTAKEELPLLVQEYLRWGLVESSIWLGVFLILIAAFLYAGRLFRNHDYQDDDNEVIGKIIFGNFGMRIIAALVFFSGFVPELMTIAKIYWAPRVYLLEQIGKIGQ